LRAVVAHPLPVAGESLEDVRARFRRMVELGRADENDDYIIFRWRW